jgi:heme-degrading monooxygenase HmoA
MHNSDGQRKEWAMFVAVYAFKVKPAMEEQFQKAWATRTREIMTTSGGLGSRLHKNEDGTFIAYAQWPSRKAWEEASPLDSEARKIMRETTTSTETLYRLDVLEDLLVHD